MPIEITGKILNDLGFPATGGYRVKAMEYSVGTDQLRQLGTDIPLSSDGSYKLLLDKNAANVHLQIVDANNREVGRTTMQQVVSGKAHELYWAVPSVAGQSEYTRLRTELQTKLDLGEGRLKEVLRSLQEDPEKNRRDFTLLAQQIGWDARVIAMMARAELLSDSDIVMREYYYAAFRAGLPLEEGQENLLHRAEITGLIAAWKQAASDKIISPELGKGDALKAAAERFQSKAQALALAYKAAGSTSTMDDLLKLSLPNEADRRRFIDLYSKWQGAAEAFWAFLLTNGFTDVQVKALQLDAQLGNLTLNNAPVMLKMKLAVVPLDDLVRLALAGYFDANSVKWATLFPDAEIAVAFEEGSVAVRRSRYIQVMADQIHKSYPTAVITALVTNDVLPVAAAEKTAVVAHLTKIATQHIGKTGDAAKPFEFGTKLLKNTEGYAALAPTTQAELKKLERTFQLTPDDTAMQGLLKNGLHSAMAIVKLSRNGFIQQFGTAFAVKKADSLAIAEGIYQKALQIHTATLNMAIAVATYQNNPLVQAVDGVPITTGAIVNQTLVDPRSVLNYPTLENLFGNLDYCECSECRSVLSPAAYLVDLLQFLDRERDMDGAVLSRKPLDVLLERRPDIADLELSCENTNTAMPYIDLVNEVMEHYVQNGASVAGLKPFNVAEGTASADLIADPIISTTRQNRMTFVYENVLRNTKAPLPILPFNYSLEHLRAWFDAHETPLAEALWTLKGSNEDILLENLQLSRETFAILALPITADALPSYFDFVPSLPTLTTAQKLGELSNARLFAQALDLSYKELIELLKTPFVNPQGLDTTLKLLNDDEIKFKLLENHPDVNVRTSLAQAAAIVQGLRAAPILPADIAPLFGNDVKRWLIENDRFQFISDLQSNIVTMDRLFLRRNMVNLQQNQATGLDMLKLMRFVRLWRATGWKLADFAKICPVLLPEAEFATVTEANIDRYFRFLTLRCGFVRLLQNQLGLGTKKGFDDFVQLWQNNPILNNRPAELRQYEALARLLKMKSVTDVQLLVRTGLTGEALVFMLPQIDSGNQITSIGSLLSFIDLTKKIKTAKIKLKEWDYLALHNDPDGKLTPSVSSIQTVILQIKSALRQADNELSQVADLEGLRLRLGQVFDTQMTDVFFELLADQKTYVAALDVEVLPAELEVWVLRTRLSFDNFERKIAVKGRLTVDDFNSLPGDIPAPVSAALSNILIQSQQSVTDFFIQYPALQPVFDAYQNAATQTEGISALLALLLPDLKDRLQKQIIRQVLAVATKTDAEIIAALIEDNQVLSAAASPNLPLVNDLLRFEANDNFNRIGGKAFISVPTTEGYEITAETAGNYTIQLIINGQVVLNGAVSVGRPLRSLQPITLKGEQAYQVGFEIVPNGQPQTEPVVLKIRNRNTAKPIGITPYLISNEDYIRGSVALRRVFKATQAVRLFRLNALEINYLCRQPAFKLAVNSPRSFLNGLATEGGQVNNAESKTAALQALNLVDYVLLRESFDALDEGLLLHLLQNPTLVLTNGKPAFCEALNTNRLDMEALLTRFTGSNQMTGLADFGTLGRVIAALNLVTKWNGATAVNLLSWTKTTPSVLEVNSLKTTLQPLNELQFGREAWQSLLKQVNDPLRARQRDALVAWILNRHKNLPATDSRRYVNTLDKLFEYFLIDPGMEPVIQTSPIRQALSSVQLFIHRLLMNLEPQVSPRAIPTTQWSWMKRYRVWEANRKIFLFPENWLEPELRDNKSPFFKDFENELLQSDITDELAEAAYLRYLEKLDDVAKLDICGMYVDERDTDAKVGNTDDIVHVFGRTNGASRRFFYRRYEGGSWTAWEKVDLPIEGNQVMPVMWKGRLFLFWLSWRKTDAQYNGGGTGEVGKLSLIQAQAPLMEIHEAVLTWSELFNGKWQAPRSAEGAGLVFEGNPFDRGSVSMFCHVFLEPTYKNQILEVNIGGYTRRFFNKNSNPEKADAHTTLAAWQNNVEILYGRADRRRQYRVFNKENFEVNIKQPADASKEIVTTKLFEQPNWSSRFYVLPPSNPMENVWEAPFFYHDATNVFSADADETSYAAVWKLKWYYEPPRFEIPKRYDFIEPIITQDLLRLPSEVVAVKGLDQIIRRVNSASTVLKGGTAAQVGTRLGSGITSGILASGIFSSGLRMSAVNPSTSVNVGNTASGTTLGSLLGSVGTTVLSSNLGTISGTTNPINSGLLSGNSIRLGGTTSLNLGGGVSGMRMR